MSFLTVSELELKQLSRNAMFCMRRGAVASSTYTFCYMHMALYRQFKKKNLEIKYSLSLTIWILPHTVFLCLELHTSDCFPEPNHSQE